MQTRLWIAAMIYPMVNAVLFGAGVITLLSIPLLAERANIFIWFVVAASFIFAAPVSWVLAPRLRLRYWRQREANEILSHHAG